MFYPHYLEQTIKTRIIKVGEGEDTRYIPDLPVQPGLCLVYCDNRNHYAYPLPASTLGKDCICHIVYKTEDDAKVQKFAGKLGLGNEVCKLTEYKAIVQTTVADVKIAEEKAILTAEAEKIGEVVDKATLDKVTYTEADALDGAPLWVFQTKGYKDYEEVIKPIDDKLIVKQL